MKRPDWQPTGVPGVDVAIIAGHAIRRHRRGSVTTYVLLEREYPTLTAAWMARPA